MSGDPARAARPPPVGSAPAGALHVVATPIGNLADITYRAVEVLGRCSVVAAEDTRRFRILAERYGLRPRRVVRCDEHTEEAAARELVAVMEEGDDVALTTDAGTPGISDPGQRLIRRARERGIRVVPVPGPSAVLAALSASGLSGDRFLFAGFPPRRAGPLRAFLEPLLARPETLVLLESSERILGLLSEIEGLAPGRRVVLARELTKLHEELLDGTAAGLRERFGAGEARVRGELVLVVEGAPAERRGARAAGPEAARAREILARPWSVKLSRRDVADLLAVALGLDRRSAYRLAHTSRDADPGRDL